MATTLYSIDFVGVPVAGVVPLAVQFTDMSSPVPSAWLWNFGDGQTSTLRNPLHTYPSYGTFSVSLSVTF